MQRITALIVTLLMFVSVADGASRKNVLILHEGSRLLPYQILMAREIQKDLISIPSRSIEIFEEYLDNSRLDQEKPDAASALDAKYSGRKFDVVLADGTGAFQLLLDSPPDFLRGTPVVFVSVPDYHLPPKLPANFTGIRTHVDYTATVQLAQTLQPDLQRVYFIESEPQSEAVKNEVLKGEFQPFRNRLNIFIWEHDDVETILKKVSSLPPHSAVLFDSYYADPSARPTFLLRFALKSQQAPTLLYIRCTRL